MWKIRRNMLKIWRNMKKYVNILDLALSYPYGSWDLERFWAPPSCSLWNLEKCQIFPLCMGLGNWKNFMPEHPPGLKSISIPSSTYMEIGSGILSPASLQALGFEKMLSFLFLRLQPAGEAPNVARCEMSLFCLLHISSKLFLLTYISKP